MNKKIALTNSDKTVIKYAKLCGMSWIAKDLLGLTYAYAIKPQKDSGGNWFAEEPGRESLSIVLAYPLSFISCEDDEPYYIGD